MIETLVCRMCSQVLPLSAFAKDAGQKNGYRKTCKACHAAKQRRYRAENPDRYAITQQRYKNKLSRGESTKRVFNPDRNYDYKKNYLDEIKIQSGCIRCGEDDPCCLSFHHVDPDIKLFSISDFASRTLNELDTEIAKCVVLCENCHRKFHAGRFSL